MSGFVELVGRIISDDLRVLEERRVALESSDQGRRLLLQTIEQLEDLKKTTNKFDALTEAVAKEFTSFVELQKA